MRRKQTVFIFIVILLSACTAVPMNKVIEKDIPFNVKEVIHKEKVKDGVILLYLTHQKNKQGEFDALTVAFLKGNDKDGWENAGHNHWEYEEDEQLTVYTTVFYVYDREGNVETRLPVIFGKIENKEYNRVEVLGAEERVDSARVIKKESGRYYIKVGDYKSARGISNDGAGMGRPD